MSSKRKTIVVSAVSLRKGGTLTILQDCLCYLSALAADGNYRVIALVHTPLDVVGGLLIACVGIVWYKPMSLLKKHNI